MKRFVTPFLLCLALLAWLIVPGLAVGSPESLPVTELNSKFIRAESDPWPASPAAVWGESWAYASARINDGEYWETVGSLWLLPTGQGESTLIDSCPWPMVWSDVEAPINSPDMADGTLVWSEKRDSGGDYDIYGYDMASETLFPVCTAAGDQTSPRVSGDLVVWVDDRDASTSRDIYGFDLNAKAEFPICRHPSQQTDPDVSGTTVVWADARQGDGDVYAATVDLARRTASEFVVFSHAGAQAQPGIAGSQVVWADARDAETHIYGKDLQGGGVQLLSGLAGEQIEPIVSDGTVLWFQNDVQYSDDYRLDGLNLGTGESFTTAVEINNPIHPYLYAIDGPRFSWGFGERHGAMVHLCEFDWQSSVTIADGKAWVTSPVLPLALSAKTAWNVVTDMRFSYDSVHWTSFRPYVPATSFALPPADGMRSVFVQFRGDDGRLSPVVTDEVGLDAVPPLTADDADDAWHASDVTVRLQSVDATSGVAGTEYRIDGGVWTDGTQVAVTALIDHSYDGTHRIDYRSTDVAGNVESVRSCTVKIDTTPPTTNDGADGAWHSAAYALVLTPSDAHSGVQKTEYRVNGGAWQSGATLSIASDGVHAVTYRSTDNAGNVEADRSATVKIDTVASETTQSGADDAWHQSPVTVSFAASDATSGVEKTEYRLDAGSWTQGSQITVLTDGDHVLRYRSQDKAGNIEEANTCPVRIDRMPPVTTQTGADGRWHNLAVAVAFTASDRASGVASTSFSADGGVTWETGACIVDAPATHDNDGIHIILYRSADNTGLVEAPRSCTVRIDTRQPVTAAPYSTKVKRGDRATLRYRVDDQQPCASKANVTIKVATLSGRVVRVFKLGQRSVNRLLTCQFRCTVAKRTYRFRVYATDAAGNKQAVAGWNRLIVR